LNGKTVYKVVLGAFSSRDSAVALMKKMNDRGIKGFPRDLKDLK
jgi:cell division septation protein DedD